MSYVWYAQARRRSRLRYLCVLAAVLACLLAAPAARAAEASFPFAQALPGAIGGARGHSVSPARIRELKSRVAGTSLVPSETEPHWGCPESTCDELIDPAPRVLRTRGRVRYVAGDRALYEGSGEKGGLDPQDLESAYRIPTSTGQGQTVGIVDAYGYPGAEEALAIYRKKYDLPACTKANGCFEVVNQRGEEGNLPPEERAWDGEQALDIEMVSAACPACKIVLAQANSASTGDLEQAEGAAARSGAQEISNSYGSPEEECEGGCSGETSAYDIPGTMVFVSSGDWGYDDQRKGLETPSFPATLPFVIAVGGTNLHKAAGSRGWEDSAWADSGSGCSRYEPKPAWQHDAACSKRMVADVAAVASCETPLSVYGPEGWALVCGTSASSPLVAGIEAHASDYARSLPGADAFYSDEAALIDVTSGSNGTCTPPSQDAYFCQAGPGYDGPTGEGVPNGPLGVEASPPNVSTLGPSSASTSSATLAGIIDPQGQATSYRFEYGTSTSYGSSAPVPEGTIEAGNAQVDVQASVGGLRPDSTYHYRLVAESASGTTYGADQAFETALPSVSSVSPGSGPPDGGTSVKIEGSDLDGATAVHFGQQEAVYFEVTSSGSITADAPYGTGSQPVSVTTPIGTSAPNGAAAFAYGKAGSVIGWGLDYKGSLGAGVRGGQADVPLEVVGLHEAVQLTAGYSASYALTGQGTVMSWGANFDGQLGDASTTESSLPVEVCAAGHTQGGCSGGPYLQEVTQVAGGDDFAVALLRDGRVLTWGTDKQGELGRPQKGTLAEEQEDEGPGYVCSKPKGTPSECAAGHYLEDVTAIAAGPDFALALLSSGKVMGWGADYDYQLGSEAKKLSVCETTEGNPPVEEKGACSLAPVPVEGVSEASAIAAGTAHALALLRNGSVLAWGADSEGQLGSGSSSEKLGPVEVCAAGELAPCAHHLTAVSAIAAGDYFSSALLQDGRVVDWGSNARGRLGDGSLSGPETCGAGEPCSRSPVAVSGLEGVTTLAAGEEDSNTIAVTAGGELLTWGGDAWGQLGSGMANEPSASPARICAAFTPGTCPDGPYLEGQVTSLGVGGYHSLVSLKVAPAVVTQVEPKEGPGSGGNTVTITGTGFSEASAVDFGSTPAQSYRVISETEILAVAPRGSGTVTVAVTTPAGSSEPRLEDRYTFESPAITSISPDFGAAAGGTSVKITGAHLLGASAVEFGKRPASEFQVRSAQEIVAVAPSGEGSVQLTVTTPDGTSPTGEASRFTYQSRPTVLTEEAGSLRSKSAVLKGSVNPNLEKITNCVFEYGTTSNYGTTRSCKATLGEGSTPEHISLEVTGLLVGTTYHYRLVAENALGTGYGEDREFTTASIQPPEIGRCIGLAQTDGEFENEACTTKSAAHTGRYEWDQGAGALPGFTASSGAILLSTYWHGHIRCTGSSLEGSYPGPWSAQLGGGALTGCELSSAGKGILRDGASGTCESSGAASGEIRLDALEGLLAFEVQKGTRAAWGIQGATDAGQGMEHLVANFHCEGEELLLEGGTVAPVEPTGSSSTDFTLTLEGSKEAREFAGAKSKYGLQIDKVSSESLQGEAAYLSGSVHLQDEEPLELRTAE